MERKISITFRGAKLFVNFPNVGQLIDIEALKQAYTNGRYGSMVQAGVRTSNLILDYVDAISFIQTCVPQIARIVEIKNYSQMSPLAAAEIVKTYKEQIEPWLGRCMEELYNFDKEENGVEEKETNEG